MHVSGLLERLGFGTCWFLAVSGTYVPSAYSALNYQRRVSGIFN